jgi:hypothetical protein
MFGDAGGDTTEDPLILGPLEFLAVGAFDLGWLCGSCHHRA